MARVQKGLKTPDQMRIQDMLDAVGTQVDHARRHIRVRDQVRFPQPMAPHDFTGRGITAFGQANGPVIGLADQPLASEPLQGLLQAMG
jgi:hypothetical protein